MTKSNGRYKSHLLLVADEPEFRSVAAKHLGRQGYRVEEVDNGEQALEIAHRRAFDAALVDMVMPQMSGIELLEQLKAGGECEVILLTGNGTVQSAVKAMKLGAYDYLTKPVRMAQLEAVVEKACNAARLQKENRQFKAVVGRRQNPSAK